MPTLWKGEHYKTMLPSFNDHPLVGEIIIIDNDTTNSNQQILNLEKVKHLPQVENIYVNPAWNLGVEESKFDIICLYSDDVLFDTKHLEMICEKCVPENGITGFSIECISEKIETLNQLESTTLSWETPRVVPVMALHYRFGICMFMHKWSYHKIPQQFKIYYGDTHLFEQNVFNSKQHFKIEGVPVATKMKTTTKHFSEVIDQDDKHYNTNPFNEMVSNLIKSMENESQ